MTAVRFVHWNQEEADEKALRIRELGYSVRSRVPEGPGFFRELREEPPDVIVIDLCRLPSQGRDIALGVRRAKRLRHIPLLFVGGDRTKAAAIQKILPDALFSDWEDLAVSLEKARLSPLENPIVPSSVFEAYSGKPLAEKLGIKPRSALTLIHAPAAFEKTLSPLPDGVRIDSEILAKTDLLIYFVRSEQELEDGIRKITESSPQSPVWIVWPKRKAGKATFLTQQEVRRAGLDAGLVDYKICSVDRTWSGLLFRKRRKPAS